MHRSNPSTLLLAQLTFYAAPLLLVGCGFGTPAPPSPVAGVALQGHVFGGQQPVSGSIMQLYAVGNTGNGSLATPLILTPPTSGPNGSFSISNDYTCPVTAPATPVYLTATGGNRPYRDRHHRQYGPRSGRRSWSLQQSSVLHHGQHQRGHDCGRSVGALAFRHFAYQYRRNQHQPHRHYQRLPYCRRAC